MSNFSQKEGSRFSNEKTVFCILFILIFSFSFYLYSPYTNIRFSSDHAVHVLMAHDFKFPDNLYFWGQNRLGSFIPMVAHIICSVPGIPPLFAVTFVHWGIILLTSLMICRMLSSTLTKVLFLVFWLIPLYPFKEHLSLAHPYAPQFFFIFSGLFLLEKFQSAAKAKYFWFGSGMVVLLLSCWISELSALFIALFMLFKIASRIKYENHQLIFSFGKEGIVLSLISLLAIVTIAWFISYAKAHAANVAEYASILSDTKEWEIGIKKHSGDILNILAHPLTYPFKWIYAVLFFPALILTVISFRKHHPFISVKNRFYLRLFSVSALLIWFGLYTLAWTYLNEFDYRHWTFAYLFAVLAILLASDNIPGKFALNKILLLILACVQIPISCSYATDISTMRNDIDFSYSEFKKFKQLGNCGVIGNYWYTYLVAAAEPDSIVATPRELEYARNPELIPLVFQKPKIFLAKNRWIPVWPPFAGQYGHLLQKSGTPFKIEWVEFCEYKLIDHGFSLTSRELKYDSSCIKVSDAIRVNPRKKALNAFAVFGPFMELPAGNYKGSFVLDSVIIGKEEELVIDIISNWGERVYFGKTISGTEIQQAGNLKIPFAFNLPNAIPNIETRIFVKGKASFTLKRIEFARTND